MNTLPQSTLNRVATSVTVINKKLNDCQDRASILPSGGWAFQVKKCINSDSNGVGKRLDLEQISDMRAKHNLSLTQTQGILKYFETAMGRSAVESHAKGHLQKKNSFFSRFLTSLKLRLDSHLCFALMLVVFLMRFVD